MFVHLCSDVYHDLQLDILKESHGKINAPDGEGPFVILCVMFAAIVRGQSVYVLEQRGENIYLWHWYFRADQCRSRQPRGSRAYPSPEKHAARCFRFPGRVTYRMALSSVTFIRMVVVSNNPLAGTEIWVYENPAAFGAR
jgi:hypothetical protein